MKYKITQAEFIDVPYYSDLYDPPCFVFDRQTFIGVGSITRFMPITCLNTIDRSPALYGME